MNPHTSTIDHAFNEADERYSYLEAEANRLAADWTNELVKTGIILDLGWEQADINLSRDEYMMTEKREVSQFEYLEVLAWGFIESQIDGD